ncbi:thiamine-phosphate kinase [Edaphobacter dinghuensis]|uniref:Thiamine-monophosphate kinase n=1 Tax=Edaphobacter dinghuensis TaxID=1560005 RepID=A0A917HUN1_9BACT|nr:thiamine-phosphate kinase [Edaphobacter dinghuensis]GGG89028.1 thiamine-monophosphate kinase [Edaphobacter dinghuensis]
MRELALIEQIRRDFGSAGSRAVALGIGDDCAILRPPAGTEVLVTTDFTLEGRHFRRDLHSPESVGHRCLARGLSDLAAMGATPMTAFLSLALPADLVTTAKGRGWIARFFRGLRSLAGRHDITLAGGDTAQSPADAILADIVLLGTAPRGRALRRSGAKPGDALYVTGALGGAAAELSSMLAHNVNPAKGSKAGEHPQTFPEPRVGVGQALLRRKLATACIDISDGISTDLAHLCRSSGVTAELEQAAIPLHPLASKLSPAAALSAALHGGEDYELLFAAPASVRMPRQLSGVPITRIGQFRHRQATRPLITLLEPDGSRATLEPQGWEHFSGR